MSEAYTYDRTPESLRKVFELHGTDTHVLCPVCNADLILAVDGEDVRRYKVHPGIYCPVNPRHVYVMVELTSIRDDFWQWMNDRAKAREENP